MKAISLVFLLTAATVASGLAHDLDGTWKAVFTGPAGEQPKTVDEIIFTLKVDGETVTGTVHAGNWPGDAQVSDGRVVGDKVTFTMLGRSPSRSGIGGAYITAYPKLSFTGITSGRDMQVTLLWKSVRADTGEETADREFPMKAVKVD